MKKIAGALAVVFAVSLLVTVIIFAKEAGFTGGLEADNKLTDNIPTNQSEASYNSNEFDSVEIKTTMAETTVTMSDTDEAKITYHTNSDAFELETSIVDETLIIKEKMPTFTLFVFWSGNSTLKIELPKKMYDEFKTSSTSGTVTVDEISADNLSFKLTSGNVNINVLSGKKMDIDSTSGKINVNKIGSANTFEKITTKATSGNQVIKGFDTEEYEVKVTSGSISFDGISGEGKVKLTSGTVELIYSNWNDSLDIDMTSGKVLAFLPENSGLKVNFTGSSGKLGYSLGDFEGSVGKSSNGVTVGEDNVQEVKAHLTSGNVFFRNVTK